MAHIHPLTVLWGSPWMGNPKARRMPDENGNLRCVLCMEHKPPSEFMEVKSNPYKDGTPRYTSYCKPCRRTSRSQGYARSSINRIINEHAPRKAAERLITERSEVLDVIRRAYPFLYDRILREEREKLLARHDEYLRRVREKKASGHYSEKRQKAG